MLTESFVAATENVKPPAAHLSSALKDVGIYLYQFQPQNTLQHGFKKSSVAKNCLAVSDTHIFAAQAGKAIINVYNRDKGNQEVTIPLPQKISSLTYSTEAAVLVIGLQDGRLMLWEVATGRVSTTPASHINAVTILAISPDGEHVLSASSDSIVHVWSLKILLSITHAQSTHGNADSNLTKDPVATFTQHRTAVQALATGHAPNHSTNFAVSASEDKTCYVWSLSTLSVLRTILLVENPLCAILDPADRAVYIGSADGSIQFIDLYESNTDSSILDQSVQIGSIPTQLTKDSKATPPSAAKLGAAQCITCSYDGTSLVTGHTSGTLVRWDIAKRRVVSEITNLSSQSATCIQMLTTTGFSSKSRVPDFRIPMVVKPRPELSTVLDTGDSPVPVNYVLNLQVTHTASQPSALSTALHSDGLPEALLGDAVQSLIAKKTSNGSNGTDTITDTDSHQMGNLKEEVSRLQTQVDAYQRLEKQRLEWHADKMKRRDAIGLQKREAFFKAKKDGRNGDEAMKQFEHMEREIDDEIDEGLYQEQESAKSGVDTTMSD